MIFVLAFGMTLVSCDDDEDPATNIDTTSITALVVATEDFSMLETAVTTADLGATLSAETTNGYTVFAPSNAAFTAAGLDMAYLSNSANKVAISDILKYHVLASTVKAADAPAGPNAKVATLKGDSVYITRNSSGVFVNGAKVATADINASNGVIHKIETLLMPPKVSITAAISGDDSLSVLLAAIQYVDAGPNGAGIATLLSGSAKYTVFAPTNSALIAALDSDSDGDVDATDLDALGKATVGEVLKNHVVAGIAFSSDLSNNQKLTSLASGADNLTVDIAGGTVKLKSTGNTAGATVTKANIVTKNGVVHKINGLLNLDN